jgi:hypothetical protein
MKNIIKIVSVVVFFGSALQQMNTTSGKCVSAVKCFTGTISPDCDEEPIIVRGHACTITGTPLGSVTVKMLQGGVVVTQTTTDDEGGYCMGGFKSGSYVLNFTCTGYVAKNVNLTFSSEVVRTDTLIAQ